MPPLLGEVAEADAYQGAAEQVAVLAGCTGDGQVVCVGKLDQRGVEGAAAAVAGLLGDVAVGEQPRLVDFISDHGREALTRWMATVARDRDELASAVGGEELALMQALLVRMSAGLRATPEG